MSENETPLEQARDHLLAHAIQWLARWSGQDPRPLLEGLPQDAGEKLAPYRGLLDRPSRGLLVKTGR